MLLYCLLFTESMKVNYHVEGYIDSAPFGNWANKQAQFPKHYTTLLCRNAKQEQRKSLNNKRSLVPANLTVHV